MKYEFLTRRVSLLIYADDDDINYKSSCQININGNHATIDTLNGRGFYKFIEAEGIKPFKSLGLTELTACMTVAHYELLKSKAPDNLNVELLNDSYTVNGYKLVWIKLTEKKPE